MNKLIFCNAMLLTILVSGCQTTSLRYIEEAQSAVEARLPDVWESSLNQGAVPQNWFAFFDDTLLQNYLSDAEKHNPEIIISAIRVQQSEARLKESLAALLPVLNSDIQKSGATALNNLSISESLDYGLSANWDPDLFGRNKIEIRSAETVLAINKANEARTRRRVMAQVIGAYIQIIEADYQVQLAKDNLSFISNTLRISEARFKAGDIARDELGLAQLETANAQASVAELELSSRLLRRNFANLIGKNPDSTIKIAQSLPEPASIALSILPAEVLGRRFDVISSRAQIANIFRGLQQAERLNWPSLSLSGRLSGEGSGLGRIFDIESYITSVGASLTSIIFDGGRKSARIETARLELDEALVNYDSVLRGALLDVENSFDRIHAAESSLKALESGLVAANEVLEIERLKYNLGEGALLDVLTVQRRVNSIFVSYVSTKTQLLNAQVDAYLAIGGTPSNLKNKTIL